MPAFVEALGPANVKPAKPVMGAEDFALYSEGNVPICMFWLGTISPERIAAAAAQGRDAARAPLGEVLPGTGPEHRHRHPRHDRRGRQALAAQTVSRVFEGAAEMAVISSNDDALEADFLSRVVAAFEALRQC